MSMRDWLIIIVIVGIVLILVDGYRRKHKNTIRMKIDRNIPPPGDDDGDDPLERAELPNGGARIMPRGIHASATSSSTSSRDEDFDEDVPVLMDAINLARDKKSLNRQVAEYDHENDVAYEEGLDEDYPEDDFADSHKPYAAETASESSHAYASGTMPEEDPEDDADYDDEDDEHPYDEQEEASDEHAGVDEDAVADEDDVIYENDDYDDDGLVSPVRVSQRAAAGSGRESRIEPSFGELDPLSADELDDKPARLRDVSKGHKTEDRKESKNDSKKDSKKDNKKDNKKHNELAARQTELFSDSPGSYYSEENSDDANYSEPEEVIVINVMAKNGEHFAGRDLLPILLRQGMQLGRMSIFHKHADADANGPVMFSMANMVKPGTFDIAQMDEFSTPGVSFFLQLPNRLGNMKCFEKMLEAANSIRNSLNGELKDEHRSVITRQTIEHCRQRIQDFELAQLSKK